MSPVPSVFGAGPGGLVALGHNAAVKQPQLVCLFQRVFVELIYLLFLGKAIPLVAGSPKFTVPASTTLDGA